MSKIKAEHQISPVFVFFLIHGAQFGAGVLGFARIIAKAAGYDGWMGVLITGIMYPYSYMDDVFLIKRNKRKFN